MASITPKKIKGNTYYYARECKRVGGKPKIVWQKYLGTADDIISRSEGEVAVPEPKEVSLFEFGAVAALHSMAERLGVVDTVNRHVRKRGKGVSVGEYLVLAAVSRALKQVSKRATGEWFAGTILRRLYPHIEDEHLTSQRFWDHMDLVEEDAIGAMESDIASRLLGEFDLDLRLLVYDTTNFFTYIDTFNQRCSLPARGHSKAKRGDLRQVNLALLATADYHIPLFSKVYEGNTADRTSFLSVTDELVERHRVLRGQVEDVTLVFDKGNNSQRGMEKIDASPYRFVGSLIPSHHQDLLSIPRSQKTYEPLELEGFPPEQWSAHRTRKEVFGRERTVVITYNERLFITQLKTISRELAKAKGALEDIQGQLAAWRRSKQPRKGRRPTLEGTRKKVEAALSAQHMKQLIEVEITEEDGLPRLRYRVLPRALSRLAETTLGKKVLFTDNHDWSTKEIVAAYHARSEIEEAFKRMKRPHFVSFSPMFHWTDQKIRVHAFCCVLALTLCSLLYRQAEKAGLDVSLEKMMNELSGIREVAILYPAPKKGKAAPKPTITISSMNKTQTRLYEIFGLDRYRC
ncbi:MAG: IS1634 family transposase [Actinomycetota bacterium]